MKRSASPWITIKLIASKQTKEKQIAIVGRHLQPEMMMVMVDFIVGLTVTARSACEDYRDHKAKTKARWRIEQRHQRPPLFWPVPVSVVTTRNKRVTDDRTIVPLIPSNNKTKYKTCNWKLGALRKNIFVCRDSCTFTRTSAVSVLASPALLVRRNALFWAPKINRWSKRMNFQAWLTKQKAEFCKVKNIRISNVRIRNEDAGSLIESMPVQQHDSTLTLQSKWIAIINAIYFTVVQQTHRKQEAIFRELKAVTHRWWQMYESYFTSLH